MTMSACARVQQMNDDQDVSLPDDRLARSTTGADPLRCTDRATIPQIDYVTNAKWSADSGALAVSRIVTIPSSVTISGYEEDLRVTVLTLATGAMRELGQGSRPEWSGSGTYLSYWREDGHLYVDQNGTTVAKIETSDPEVRWKGDGLYFWYDDEIRVWHDGAVDGPVHGWTADGRLLVGAVSATVPGGNVFDRLGVWDPDDEGDRAIATLPNLLGMRSFSPDGRWFDGVSRTGNYGTQLELYRCGVARAQGVDLRADPAARSRLARIASDPRRFVRPVAGAISQFLQGNHTGIDIAAPVGSIIVAADDGVVDAVGWVQVGGRRVCVQHANDIESCYYHTSAALVSSGDHVARGQPIALIGMTGATTGPHVHWEVKQEGRIVDPLGL